MSEHRRGRDAIENVARRVVEQSRLDKAAGRRDRVKTHDEARREVRDRFHRFERRQDR